MLNRYHLIALTGGSYSTCYPGTEALPQARVLADRTRGTRLLAPGVPGAQPRMVTCRVGAARGGRVAIVILATVPQMIACLYTVPRAASMGPALGLAGMPGRESSCCSHHRCLG